MNKTSQYEFTIALPVYNEEDNLLRVEKTMKEFLPNCIKKACVLFVDDASTDNSLQMIKEICDRNPDFYYISMNKNGNITAAMKAAFNAAESPYVGWIDADLQTTPEDFNLLLPHLEDNAMAIGYRAKRKDTAFRRIQSKVANWFRRLMTGDDAIDTACPLKVIRTDYARQFPYFTGMHRFLPAIVKMMGGTYYQQAVRHFPRTAGVAKFGFRNRAVVGFVDCFAMRWMRSRYISNHPAETNL